jgi:hypothetical protein
MGMKAAMSLPLLAVPGDLSRLSAFKLFVSLVARVVLPEPGMPEMERRYRRERGRVEYFSVVGL